MTQYQIELMALLKSWNADLCGDELEKAAIELYYKIKTALDENRERTNKK